MKNLKKINRENLKSITGGRPPAGEAVKIAVLRAQRHVIIRMAMVAVAAMAILYVHND